MEQRNAWFFLGRVIPGKSTAELRRRAYASNQMRLQRAAAFAARPFNSQSSISTAAWTPLGPVPLASDATGNGMQDYHQVAGRATAVVIDPADPTGNTVYVGGAQAGVWKSTNAAASSPANVTWTPLTDDQATLSIGAIAIQPGNNDPTKSIILAATSEANNSGDSYLVWESSAPPMPATPGPSLPPQIMEHFPSAVWVGLAWLLITATPTTVVAAMAATPEGLTAGAVTTNTTRGLYTSQDSGQTWTYNALLDSGIVTAAAGKFFHRISGPLLHRFADDRSGFRTGLLTLPYKPEPDHCCRTKNRPVQPALAASGIFFQWCH